MTREERSRVNIIGYEDYTCHILSPISYNNTTATITAAAFQQDAIRFAYSPYYCGSYNNSGRTVCLIPYDAQYKAIVPKCYTTEPDDRLMFHPRSKFPRSMLSNAKVYTERSPELATLLVVPFDYPNVLYGANIWFDGPVIGLISDKYKRILMVRSSTYGQTQGKNICEWRRALSNSTDITSEIGTDFSDYEFMDNMDEYTMVEGLSELDFALLTGMIPKEKMISDISLKAGTKKLDVDGLVSVYSMLESCDEHLRDTAFQLLAQSDISGLRGIVYWLLKPYKRDAYPYKQRSSAFAWVMETCFRTNSLNFFGFNEKETAKKMFEKITKGDVCWDEAGQVVVKDPKWLNNHWNRKLIEAVK